VPITTAPGFAHCDCQIDRPTVYADDEPLVDNGRLLLLDDPAIREVAARFGPPDVILDDNPAMILPGRYSGAAASR
jgi:2,5-dihydroxypyridine 5,6-dioxygenase